MKVKLDKTRCALTDIDELSRYTSALARPGAHVLSDEDVFTRSDDWPHEVTKDDVARLFQLLHLFSEDINVLAVRYGLPPDQFAAHRSDKLGGFTGPAVAAAGSQPAAQ